MRVFLSYSRHDVTTVDELVRDLEAGHHDVWHDERLSGGQEWWNRLLEEIRQADLFVFSLSEHSLASVPCQLEYEYASRLRKRILPVRLDHRTSVQELPEALSLLQWIQYDASDKHAALSVLGSMQNLPPARELPNPLPEPPVVPVSYLTDLRDKLSDPSELSVLDQMEILSQLENRFAAQDDPIAIENMLLRLKRRNDLNAATKKRVRALLKRVDAARPRTTRPKRDLRLLVAALAGLVALGLIALALVTSLDSPAEQSQPTDPATTPQVTDSNTTAVTPEVLETPQTRPPQTDPPVAASPSTTRQTDVRPPTTLAPPDPEIFEEGEEQIDFELLDEYLALASFQSNLGCTVEVGDYAAVWGLPWQNFGSDVWYWNQTALGYLRWDGLIYYPITDLYISFCTGLQWDLNSSVWF